MTRISADEKETERTKELNHRIASILVVLSGRDPDGDMSGEAVSFCSVGFDRHYNWSHVD